MKPPQSAVLAVASTHNGTEKGLRFQVVNSDASAGPTFELFPDRIDGANPEPQLLSSPDGASLLVMRQVSSDGERVPDLGRVRGARAGTLVGSRSARRAARTGAGAGG